MKPYFSVGEEAILESKNFPYLNGDCVVLSVVKDGDIYQCQRCGELRISNIANSTYGYQLDVCAPGECCAGFSQVSLRKKHDKGMDFERLVESLKSPVQVTE